MSLMRNRLPLVSNQIQSGPLQFRKIDYGIIWSLISIVGFSNDDSLMLMMFQWVYWAVGRCSTTPAKSEEGAEAKGSSREEGG